MDYQLRIAPDRVRGFVEHSQIVGASVQFCGWAASVVDHRAADSVLIVADGHPVGFVRPTIVRTDVVKALGPVGERSGYAVTVPLALLERAGMKRRVRLLRIERGIASPLPFMCGSGAHEVGC